MSIDVTIYQNTVTSETGAITSNTFTHTNSNLAGLVEPQGSGRFFEVKVAIGANDTARIAAINYLADIIPRTERHLR